MNGPNRCPACGDRLVYVERYKRWFCESCEIYAPPARGPATGSPPRTAPRPSAGEERPSAAPGEQGERQGRPAGPSGSRPFSSRGWYGAPSTERGKAMVFDAVRRRGDADRILSPWLAIVPVTLVIAMVFIMVTGFLWFPLEFGLTQAFTACSVVIIAAVVFEGYIVFCLMRRRQDHFEMDALLRAGMIEYLTAAAMLDDVDLDAELSTMTWIDSSSRQDEPHRGPFLWTVLAVFVPIVSGIMFLALSYILTKESGKHHSNQDGFYRQMSSCLYKLGLEPVVPPSWKPIPDRDPVLYLVISIFVPFFSIYWLYVIIADMNDHFMLQWEVEDYLVEVMRRN